MDHAPLTIAERHARIRAGLSMREQRPLDFWHFSSQQSRDGVALFAADQPINELLLQGPNVGGKTEAEYAFGLACLQKRATLDGVPIPQWRGKVDAVSLELDYPTQILSSQQTVIRLLGQWPHHIKKVGARVSSIAIQPVGGNSDESTWSTLTFMSQENRKTGTGIRADIVLGNEPPDESIWREVRKARHAGRRGIRVIGMTPILRRRWEWVRDDYGVQPRDQVTRVGKHWAVARWSLWHNAALGRDHVEELLSDYGRDKEHRDPLYDARVHGDFIDTSGMCPFDGPTLDLLYEECTDPIDVVQWKITQEADPSSGRTRMTRTIPVEVWQHSRVDRSYHMPIDPSSGVPDSAHDPYEMNVAEKGSGDLCARSGGYVSGYLVGVLGAGVALQYNNAAIDPEVNDRWGVNVVEGVRDSRYGNFSKERRMLKPGEWVDEIGFHNTGKTRPLIIGAIQAWVDARRAGIVYAKCPSRKIITTLKDCILDHKGKIVASPGSHDECLITWGQALRKCVNRIGAQIPDSNPPVRSREQELIDRITGRAPRNQPPGGGPVPIKRARV